MHALDRIARTAQRRLWLNRWFRLAGWSLTAAGLAFCGLVIIQRCLGLLDDPSRWYAAAAAGLAAAAVAVSLGWSLWTVESRLVAAARLDQAAGLCERLSSGLYCVPLKDPFARAVVADAEEASRGLNARRYLPLRWPVSATCAAGSLFAAMLTLWLFPQLDLTGRQARAEEQRQQRLAVQQVETRVRPVLKEAIDKVAEKFPEAVPQAPDLATQPAQTPLDVQRQALHQIEQMQDRLDARREAARKAGLEEFTRMMRSLSALQRQGDSPVNRFSQALGRGDLPAARQALRDIQQQLRKQAATPEEKQQAEQLAKQLQELSNMLEQLAATRRQMQDRLTAAGLSAEEIRKALEAIRQNKWDEVARQLASKGLTPEQIQEMIRRMQQADGACSMAGRLGGSLGRAAAGALGTAGAEVSMDGLFEADQQLSQMEAMQQELAEVEAALDELVEARERIGGGCADCQGTGMCRGGRCSSCDGTGQSSGRVHSRARRGAGMGPNPGQGAGNVAPVQETPFDLVRQRTPVKDARGSIISQRFIDGEQFSGEVSAEFVEVALSAERRAGETIARQAIPRQYHQAIRDYFTRARQELPATRPP